MRSQFTSAALAALILPLVLPLVACGGAPKSGLVKGSKDVPPPPDVQAGDTKAAGTDKPEPKRTISKDARADYDGAIQFFATNDKGSWSESACRQSAEKFQAVAHEHTDLVEAQYMVGLSFHRCNLVEDAERAYQATLKLKANHGQSLSNLGEIYFRAGKVDGAKQYWESAVKAYPKLVAARNNLASLQLEQMRKTTDKAAWEKLESDARFNLSNVLGVDSENVKAYTLYGLVYMEGYQRNKNRLDLAKLLLDEAKKRNEKYAPLQNAFGLYYMRRNALSEALQHFQSAVEIDPKFVEARMNVGLTTLGFRKYDTAKEQFAKVLDMAPKNYDAMIGLGIAQRGLGDFDGAEAQYKKAKDVDGKRGEAFYNLAVLYKDFRATKQSDLKASQDTYRKARDFYKQFLEKDGDAEDKAEAKVQIGLCDKTISQIDDFLKNQANQPAPPAAPPAGAAPGAPAAPAAGAAPAAPAKK
jgi:tetratricopeptide (TPR) repeat protein